MYSQTEDFEGKELEVAMAIFFHIFHDSVMAYIISQYIERACGTVNRGGFCRYFSRQGDL